MNGNGVKAMGGRHNHDQFPTHYRRNEGCKFIGKPGTISIDYCDKCIRVHDGCTPGGCFKICGTNVEAEPLTASQVCDALNGAEVLGDVVVEASPAVVCASLSSAAVIGNVEMPQAGSASGCEENCDAPVIGSI